MAEVSYYFNGYAAGVEEWGVTPANMVDGSIATFAKSDNITQVEALTGNTCVGTDLGTITAVHLRLYGKTDQSEGTPRVNLRPVFGISGDGDDHENFVYSSPAWTDWVDITTDTNAPSPWTWADIHDGMASQLWCDVIAVESDNYCAKVEIKVTYTSSARRGWWSK